MKIWGDIRRLESDRGDSYFGVHQNTEGMVGVWGSSYKRITVLYQDGYEYGLCQFDTEYYFEEWMKQNSKYYHSIKILEKVDVKE